MNRWFWFDFGFGAIYILGAWVLFPAFSTHVAHMAKAIVRSICTVLLIATIVPWPITFRSSVATRSTVFPPKSKGYSLNSLSKKPFKEVYDKIWQHAGGDCDKRCTQGAGAPPKIPLQVHAAAS